MRASYAIKHILEIFLLTLSLPLTAQQAFITGKVTDEKDMPVLGVVISTSDNAFNTVTTDNGDFSIRLDSNKSYMLRFSYIGYETAFEAVTTERSKQLNISLKPSTNQLNQVIISAGKYNQEIKRVTVSTEIIKPYLLQNKAVLSIDGIMNQLPGVNIIDGQANIRGGSGWTYGAGSRVLVMLDDLPYLSGDANVVLWNFLPTENLEQMEVIKGASSVLYGSSALNGVINIRTAKPKLKPTTRFTLQSGAYNKLKRDSTRWNPNTQFQFGFNAFDSRKIKQLDLTTSINYVKDNGYRLGDNNERLRLSVNTTYYSKKIAGLNYGIDASLMYSKSQSFLLWENWSYAYTALDSQTTDSRSTNLAINPHTTFYISGIKNSVRGKVLRVKNDISNATSSANQDNASWMFYADYQLQKNLPKQFGVITGGLTASSVTSEAALFNGTHTSKNFAPYLQADIRYKKFNLSAGYRHEYFEMDNAPESKNIFRTGISYEATRSTFLRASYGQGYRFPSIAERYISTSAGVVNIFPNPGLRSETGWNAEIGLRQGFKLSKWSGLFDIAYFHTEYQNMVEFNFAQWTPLDLSNLENIFKSFGFKSVNVGSTRITGIDASVTSMGNIGEFNLKTLIGYTYINPVSLTPTKVFATDSSGTQYTYNNTSSDSSSNTLKYRYNHLAKADVELGYKKWSLGFSTRYNSYMKNTDAIFETIIPGVKQGRAINPNGDWLFDARLSYQLTQKLKANMLVNNITNHEQMSRPADMRPPRLFALQLTLLL
jgi:outer membrane receptor protein involved in Fe transport